MRFVAPLLLLYAELLPANTNLEAPAHILIITPDFPPRHLKNALVARYVPWILTSKLVHQFTGSLSTSGARSLKTPAMLTSISSAHNRREEILYLCHVGNVEFKIQYLCRGIFLPCIRSDGLQQFLSSTDKHECTSTCFCKSWSNSLGADPVDL